MKKKNIHVKEYTRKRHGRAKFGGRVRSHDKHIESGRAHPVKVGDMVRIHVPTVYGLVSGRRRVKQVHSDGSIRVNAAGWDNFLVKKGEYELLDSAHKSGRYYPRFKEGVRREFEDLMLTDSSVGVYGVGLDEAEDELIQSARKGEFEGVTPSEAIKAIKDVANEFREDFLMDMAEEAEDEEAR